MGIDYTPPFMNDQGLDLRQHFGLNEHGLPLGCVVIENARLSACGMLFLKTYYVAENDEIWMTVGGGRKRAWSTEYAAREAVFIEAAKRYVQKWEELRGEA